MLRGNFEKGITVLAVSREEWNPAAIPTILTGGQRQPATATNRRSMLAKGAMFASGPSTRPGPESLPGRPLMKASLFAQMGYAERHKFPATWPVPPSYHDPAVTMQSYQDGLEECELAEEMGFDWISCSEHHYSGNRLTPNPAVMAAAVSQRCKRVRIALLG